MKSTAETIYQTLKELDTLDVVEMRFNEKAQGAGGLAWAIERMADDVIFARKMAQLVRPLIAIYDEQGGTKYFIEAVKAQRDEATRLLVSGVWRSNSTSILQNAMNQWEGHALGRFVDQCRYLSFE